MNTIYPELTTENWLIQRAELAQDASDLLLIAQNPEVTSDVLMQVATSLVDLRHRNYPQLSEVMRAIFQSGECTEGVVDNLFCYPVTSVMRDIALEFMKESKEVPEPVLHRLMRNDYTFKDSVVMQKMLLKSPSVSERIVDYMASDWRLTVLREVAKSPLLSAERILCLIQKGDVATTVNIIKNQEKLTDESLYSLRDDPSEKVSKAAVKEISSRGLAEVDELDEALLDEVSLFFLAASDDEETLLRLASNPNTPVETLKSLADSSYALKKRVASAGTTPSSLLEVISLEMADAERGNYDHGVLLALVGNPANTAVGITALVDRYSWVRDLLLVSFKNPNCPREVIEFRGAAYSSRARIAALRTGYVTKELLDLYVSHEHRGGVLVEVLRNPDVTAELARTCYRNGNQKVKDLAMEKLEELNAPLNIM